MNIYDLLKKPEEDEEVIVPLLPGAQNLSDATTSPAPVAPVNTAQPAHDIKQVTVPRHLLNPFLNPPPVDKKEKDAEDALSEKLRNLKIDYDAAQEEARSRQMKAEMIAALGNNINQMVAGATAMNTKAAVTPAQSHRINVGDEVARVDSRYNKDYDNLLKQYKDLKDGRVSDKDRLYAAMKLGDWEMGAQRADQTQERHKDNLGHRGEVHDWKKTQADEPTSKQVETVSAYRSTIDDIDKLEDMTKEFTSGPVSGRVDRIKSYLGVQSGAKARIAAQLDGILSKYAKQMSGTAVAEQEFERLRSQLPKMDDSPEAFAEKTALFKERTNEAILRILDDIERSGRNVEKLRGNKSMSQLKKEEEARKSGGTVRIQGPSGQVATVPASKAEKYLSQSGYKKVD